MELIAFIVGLIVAFGLAHLLEKFLHVSHVKPMTEQEFLQTFPNKKWIVMCFSALFFLSFFGVAFLIPKLVDKFENVLVFFSFPIFLIQSISAITGLFEALTGWNIIAQAGRFGQTWFRTFPNIRRAGCIRLAVSLGAILLCVASLLLSYMARDVGKNINDYYFVRHKVQN